jgi:hypothetical protein
MTGKLRAVPLSIQMRSYTFQIVYMCDDSLCGLVARVSEVPSSIPGATRFFWEVVCLEQGSLSYFKEMAAAV